jgi:hypothetical protein
MSTENTIQPTANPGSAKVAEKSATATTQISLPTAKKTARKATKRAPRKTAIKAPVKTKAIVNKKPVNKTPAAPTKKASTQPKDKAKAKAAPTVPPVVEANLKKPKLVRDSFTFPKDEYQAIAGLKQKALGLKHSAKKSEILRAGLKLLSSLNDKAFLAALTNVPALKTGRPAKS